MTFCHPVTLSPACLFHGAVQRLKTRDLEGDALRRAVRAAIAVPLSAAVSFLVVGGSAAPLFTIIGGFCLRLLSDFRGTGRGGALATWGVGFTGAVLLTVGTWWLPCRGSR